MGRLKETVDETVTQSEIEEETASVCEESDSSDSEAGVSDLSSDNSSFLPFERSQTAPGAPSAEAKLSYDKAWAEFKSVIYACLRTTDLVKQLHKGIMLRPEAADSSEWKTLLKEMEAGKVCPRQRLTFGALLNLKQLRATDNEALTGFAPRWEQAVRGMTNAICQLWDHDPVLSKGLELTRANTL